MLSHLRCENYMFCKPRGLTLHSSYALRITSDSGTLEIQVSPGSAPPQMAGIPEGSFVDVGSNNGGSCSSGVPSRPSTALSTTSPATAPPPTTTTPGYQPPRFVDCSLVDGLFPDPHNCRGFIKCAQGDPYHMVSF